jgi:hypothetical protein
MVQYGIMSIVFTAFAATRHCAAFNVASSLKTGRNAMLRMSTESKTSIAASDNDFDDFSTKVSTTLCIGIYQYVSVYISIYQYISVYIS